MRLPGTVLLFAVCVLCAPPLRAEMIHDLDSPVARGSKITYAKLVERMFGGIRIEDGGPVTTSAKVLRRIGEKERSSVPAESRIEPFVEALRVRGDGRAYLVILAGVECETDTVGSCAVLAAFPEGSREPVDVADVHEDRFCSFDTKPLVPIGPADAFLIANSHSNSNQSYLITSLIEVRGRRLRTIGSVFTLGVHSNCLSFDEELTWRTEKDASSDWPAIIATVALKPLPVEDDGECSDAVEKVRAEKFRETYRFDPASGRYKTGRSDMKRLDEFNEKNF